MSYGGSATAMNSSLKSNNSLRRKKEVYSKFHKKPEALDTWSNPLSKEENILIVKQNKITLKKKTKYQVLFGLLVSK